MAIVTGYTADAMDQIRNSAVVAGNVDGDELFLTTYDGRQIDAGNVRGPQGIQGVKGDQGPVGPAAKQVDLISSWLASGPLVIAHRGAHNLYPENSMDGYRAVSKDGFCPEMDLRTLATGQAVTCHDATTDRTMTATGTVSALSLAQWRSRMIKPQIKNGAYAMGAMWSDILDEFGGNTLIVPEVKVFGAQGPLIQPIIDRQLHKAVLMQCYDLATAEAIAANGIATIYLQTAGLPAGTAPADLIAAGINYVGFDFTQVTAATVASMQAAGLKVILFTVNTYADWVQVITTMGADGAFCNDPWFVAGRTAPANGDPFREGHAWPHMAGFDGTNVLDADTLCSTWIQMSNPNALRYTNYAAISGSTFSLAMGFLGQARGPNLRLRFSARFRDGSGTTRWMGVFIGTLTDPDTVYHDAAAPGQNGYHFLIRRTGALEIYNVTPNATAASLVASGAPTNPIAPTLSGPQPAYDFEITITATTLTITNTTTGFSATIANSAHRSPSRVDFTANGSNVEWWNIGLEDL